MCKYKAYWRTTFTMIVKYRQTNLSEKKGNHSWESFHILHIWIYYFSTCIGDPEYSQYDCYYNRMREKLRENMKCLWPFQIHNNLNIGKDICGNRTEVDERTNIKSHKSHIFFCFQEILIFHFQIHTTYMIFIPGQWRLTLGASLVV